MQAAVFCNHKPQAEWLARRLSSAGYPAAYLAADRTQADRMEAMDAVRGFKLRVRACGAAWMGARACTASLGITTGGAAQLNQPTNQLNMVLQVGVR